MRGARRSEESAGRGARRCENRGSATSPAIRRARPCELPWQTSLPNDIHPDSPGAPMNAPELPATFDQAAPHLALRTYGAANLGIRRTMLDAAGASSGAPAVAPVAGELSVGVDFELE